MLTGRDVTWMSTDVLGSWRQLVKDEMNIQRKGKVRWRKENWGSEEREWGRGRGIEKRERERDGGIGSTDSLSPIKVATPSVAMATSSLSPSFQRATTYPYCLSVSRACGCVCFCVLALEWIKQMNRRAIRETISHTYGHTHMQHTSI